MRISRPLEELRIRRMTLAGLASLAAVTGSLVLGLPTAALAASQPVIETESVTGVNELYNEFNPPGHPRIDATLQAQIDTEGLETTYQFQIGTSTSYRLVVGCPGFSVCMWLGEVEGLPPHPASIPGLPEHQQPSVTLSDFSAELAPSTVYHYRVVASNSAGTTYGPDQTFTTPPVESPQTLESPPVIESLSLSHLTATDATLETQLNDEGQSTSYEFLLFYDPCPVCEDYETVKIDLPSALLLPSFQDQSVSVDLNSVGVTLRHGGEYEYSLRAINASGKTEARTQTFQTPPPPPVAEPLHEMTTPPSPVNEPAASVGDGQPAGTPPSVAAVTPSDGSSSLSKPKPSVHHLVKAKSRKTKHRKHKHPRGLIKHR